jgi:hypothetical protein
MTAVSLLLILVGFTSTESDRKNDCEKYIEKYVERLDCGIS